MNNVRIMQFVYVRVWISLEIDLPNMVDFQTSFEKVLGSRETYSDLIVPKGEYSVTWFKLQLGTAGGLNVF